jgi:hypothetical protein
MTQLLVVKLAARFEQILWKQIKTLVKSHQRHTHYPSGQSGDGLSSDSSDGEDDAIDTVGYEIKDRDYRDW